MDLGESFEATTGAYEKGSLPLGNVAFPLSP